MAGYLHMFDKNSLVFATAVARKYVGEHAEDLAQESLLRAWKNRDRFSGTCKFTSWLHGITVNTCLEWLRARKSQVRRINGLGLEPLEPAQTPYHVCLDHETDRRVRDAIANLPEIKRNLMEMIWDGHDPVDFAQLLDLNQNTVRTHLFRARKALKKALDVQAQSD